MCILARECDSWQFYAPRNSKSGYKVFYPYQLNEAVVFCTCGSHETLYFNEIGFNFGYNKNEIYVLLFPMVGGVYMSEGIYC